MDARILAGIGNIYACEILFAARLHPATPAGRLTLADWSRVLAETRRILTHAIKKGGTTVANYLNSKGETGLFQLELRVYGRTGEPCRCGAPNQSPGPGRAQHLFLSRLPAAAGRQSLTRCQVELMPR